MAMRKGSTKAKKAVKAKKVDPKRKAVADKAAKVTDAFRAKIEQIVFDWVTENFGTCEARSPSWNIRELANAVASGLVLGHEAKYEISYED